MELDDLKNAWQTLERRLDQHDALELQMFRDHKLSSLRRCLLPLRLGQALQLIFGALVVIAAASFWSAYWQEPSMLVTGLVMHAYGLLAIAAGAVTQHRISSIDYASPVLEIQKQLARLRRTYVTSGLWVGLPWALLWVVAAVMAARIGSGANLYAAAPIFVFSNLAFGVTLLVGVFWVHRWSHAPSRSALARRLAATLTGATLRRAQTTLDEISRFENDDAPAPTP